MEKCSSSPLGFEVAFGCGRVRASLQGSLEMPEWDECLNFIVSGDEDRGNIWSSPTMSLIRYSLKSAFPWFSQRRRKCG